MQQQLQDQQQHQTNTDPDSRSNSTNCANATSRPQISPPPSTARSSGKQCSTSNLKQQQQDTQIKVTLSEAHNCSTIVDLSAQLAQADPQENSKQQLTSSQNTSRPQISVSSPQQQHQNHNNSHRRPQPQPQSGEPHLLSEAPNPRQLAIYLNGKIRSNSIFRRSISTSSFGTLIGKSHASTSNQSLDGRKQRKSTKRQHKRQKQLTNDDFDQTPNRRKQHRGKKSDEEEETDKDDKKQQQPTSVAKRVFVKLGLINIANADAITASEDPNSNKQLRKTSRSKQTNKFDRQKVKNKYRQGSATSYLKSSSSLTSSTSASSSSSSASFGARSSHDEVAAKQPTTSYKLNPASMFLRKAMRYYRLWIYSTNVVIFVGTLIFVGAALFVGSDYRVELLSDARASTSSYATTTNNTTTQTSTATTTNYLKASAAVHLSAFEPAMLVAYLAIATQAGLLQALGCFGAVRMKERWIKAFWLAIVALVVFDVSFLAYWLRRYDSLVGALHNHLHFRLQQHYGGGLIGSSGKLADDNQQLASFTAAERAELERRFSEIFDKMQRDGKCCGLSGARDYHASEWRRARLISLKSSHSPPSDDELDALPLVPASCCRPSNSLQQPTDHDDSRAGWRSASSTEHRTSAWPPSAAASPFGQRSSSAADRQARCATSGPLSRRRKACAERLLSSASSEQSLADIIDCRWLLTDDRDTNDDCSDGSSQESNERRRRKRATSDADADADEAKTAVEARVDSSGTVEARVIELPAATGENNVEKAWRAELAALRRRLFEVGARNFSETTFRTRNELSLSFGQYKLLEAFLINQESSKDTNSNKDSSSAASGRGRGRGRRAPKPTNSNNDEDYRKSLWKNLEAQKGSNLKCTPSSYSDKAIIYTTGCSRQLRAWLDSSAHILFVAGFCVLTVLKFCSVLLLRLELREMIHKIRVLKGMATEYSALHDLEAYLPRASLSAHLTAAAGATTVAAAATTTPPLAISGAPTATTTTTTETSSTTATKGTKTTLSHSRVAGGSFSEAVAAATAQAAASGQLSLGGLVSAGRASSMKALAHVSSMLSPTPSLYPRSSSTASTHLHAIAMLAQKQQQLQYQPSDVNALFAASGAVSRRHTAVSVSAAPGSFLGGATGLPGSATAALAHRRGTYAVVPNPLYDASGVRSAQWSSPATSASRTHLTTPLTSSLAQTPPAATTTPPPSTTSQKHLLDVLPRALATDLPPLGPATTTVGSKRGASAHRQQSAESASAAIASRPAPHHSHNQAEIRRSIH